MLLLHRSRQARKLLVRLLIGSSIVLLSLSHHSPFTRRAYCTLQSKSGLLKRSSFCQELLAAAGAPEVVQIWKTDPLPNGFHKSEILVPGAEEHNVTRVNFAFRSAVIDTAPYEHETDRLLMRAFLGIWDTPLGPDAHLEASRFFSHTPSRFHHRGSIIRRNAKLTEGHSDAWLDTERSFSDAREYSYWVPKRLFNESELDANSYFTFNFSISYQGKLLHSYLFDLRRHHIPRSPFAICMKPLYGSAVPPMLVECELGQCAPGDIA